MRGKFLKLSASILSAMLFCASPVRAQEEQQTVDTQASDFVIGLNALNTQIKAALDEQPTNRVVVVPFKGTDSAYPRVSRFLADQLVTALVSQGDFSILPAEPFHELLQSSDLSPMNLAGTAEFTRLRTQFENTSIVVGTITDLDSKIAIMARIINSESGNFSGGAMVYLKVADEFAALVDKDRPEPVDTGDSTTEKPEEQGGMQQPAAEDATTVQEPEPDHETRQETPAEQRSEISVPEMRGESDEAIYSKAKQEFFDTGRYSAAIELFEMLVERFPDSVYADNAIYWIGEAHYSMKEWQKARQQFQRVLDNYPYGNKVPDATMKRGYAEEKLGMLNEAIFSMEEVIRRFGTTSFADRAKAKLQKLRALKQKQSSS